MVYLQIMALKEASHNCDAGQLQETLVLFSVTPHVLICFLAITSMFWLQMTQDL